MDPRLRRLQADYNQIDRIFKNHPYIHLISIEGDPPERYQFEFKLRGLIPNGTDGVRISDRHCAEIFLPIDYPRRPPFCRMTTPVYHPNIDPQKICIGDHWSAGQSLAHLVIRIAEIICYQSYNTKSPLNAEAAAWAEKNADNLPLECADLSQGL